MPREARMKLEDRRTETRFPADEDVRLRPQGLMSPAIKGRLLDVAASGFRVQHESRSLVSGVTVHFDFPGVEGLAQVMWTRILGNSVESGFHILWKTTSIKDSAA
jgi:hypothetical protein